MEAAQEGETFYHHVFLFHLRDSNPSNPMQEFQLNVFSWRHPKASIVALTKKRPGSRRLYLFLVMIAIAMIISPFSGEGQVQYLFVRTKFGWGVDEFSNYRSFDSAMGIIGDKNIDNIKSLGLNYSFCLISGEIICIPFFAWLKLNESIVFLIVTLSPFLRHLIQGVSMYPWMYYLGSKSSKTGLIAEGEMRLSLLICSLQVPFSIWLAAIPRLWARLCYQLVYLWLSLEKFWPLLPFWIPSFRWLSLLFIRHCGR